MGSKVSFPDYIACLKTDALAGAPANSLDGAAEITEPDAIPSSESMALDSVHTSYGTVNLSTRKPDAIKELKAQYVSNAQEGDRARVSNDRTDDRTNDTSPAKRRPQRENVDNTWSGRIATAILLITACTLLFSGWIFAALKTT